MRMGFINRETCYRLGEKLAMSAYGEYVKQIAVPTAPERLLRAVN